MLPTRATDSSADPVTHGASGNKAPVAALPEEVPAKRILTDRRSAGERWKAETARIVTNELTPRRETPPSEITRPEIVELLDVIADRGAAMTCGGWLRLHG